MNDGFPFMFSALVLIFCLLFLILLVAKICDRRRHLQVSHRHMSANTINALHVLLSRGLLHSQHKQVQVRYKLWYMCTPKTLLCCTLLLYTKPCASKILTGTLTPPRPHRKAVLTNFNPSVHLVNFKTCLLACLLSLTGCCKLQEDCICCPSRSC